MAPLTPKKTLPSRLNLLGALTAFGLALLLILRPSLALGQTDAEIQKYLEDDPNFADVKDTLWDTWDNYPEELQGKASLDKIDWPEKFRDKEGPYLKSLGLSPNEALAIAIAYHNNALIDALPEEKRSKFTYIDINSLLMDYKKYYLQKDISTYYKNQPALEPTTDLQAEPQDETLAPNQPRQSPKNPLKVDDPKAITISDQPPEIIFKIVWGALITLMLVSLVITHKFYREEI
jgi:hypothetical protein